MKIIPQDACWIMITSKAIIDKLQFIWAEEIKLDAEPKAVQQIKCAGQLKK